MSLLILNKNKNMKKIILTVAAVFAFGLANAQDLKSKKGENYLPEAGDWAISFNSNNLFKYVGNAFSSAGTNEINSVSNSNSSGYFTGKKFITASKADRYTAGFELSSGSATVLDAAQIPATPTTPAVAAVLANETKTTKIKIAAGIGKEWRKGKTRLQGFYGYDLVASLTLADNAKTTYTVSKDVKDVKGGFGFGVGANGFLGAEYFIFPKIAIGAQYTYGVNLNIAGASTTTDTNGTTGISSESKGAKSTTFGVGNVGVASMNLTLHF